MMVNTSLRSWGMTADDLLRKDILMKGVTKVYMAGNNI